MRDVCVRIERDVRDGVALADEPMSRREVAFHDPQRRVAAVDLLLQARELVGEIGQLSHNIKGDTLPQVGAFAESADRSARRIGSLADDLSRNPDSVLWGRKPGRPGPGEPGFQ